MTGNRQPDPLPHRPADRLAVLDLGVMRYAPAMELQDRMAAERAEETRGDTLILLEHTHVYTLGRNAADTDFLLPKHELERQGIDIVRTGRGGQTTYHGPGQLVAYPILNLRRLAIGVADYVGMIELAVSSFLRELGIEPRTDPDHRGVWVGTEKIAAVGIRVSRQVTTHGFALNVRPDMTRYSGIVPCGIRDRGVTSLSLLERDMEMTEVKKRIADAFAWAFGYDGVFAGAEKKGGS
ncbi:MAG: lipoyl(octanoyl) transferase LipB [Lentisphaerae bacterium]|nr:lipoyl(octanoyl) transferase LipB [Lentisphaerota bacterium]